MKNYPYVNNRKRHFIFTGIVLAACILSLAIFGLNFGIDFAGGTIIQFELHETFENSEIMELIGAYDEDATITSAGEGGTIVVISSIKDFSEEEKLAVISLFAEKYGTTDADLLSFNRISASVGRDLQRQAVTASAVTVVCILIYITFRFELLFGIAAILALIHDILVVLGIYAILRMPVNSSFIAAILTILGYSINNTIIVFDRVRENRRNRKVLHEETAHTLVDTSVNQTFSRSLNTTITTLLAVLAVYIFGVSSVREFTLPMIVGFVAGFYSSVFLAGNMWYVLTMQRIAKNT